MYKLLLVLGWLLIITNALEVAKFPPVSTSPTSLVAIKQKLKQKATNRVKAEDHQTRSLELEKLQLQRDLDAAEEYRFKANKWGFGNIGNAIGGAVSSAVTAVKDEAHHLIDKGKEFLGIGGRGGEEEIDTDCKENCHDETEGEERHRLEKQRHLHERMDEMEKSREARELEREQMEALREQELQEKIEREEERKKQHEEEGGHGKRRKEDEDDDPDDPDDDGQFPTKPLHMRGKKRVCKDGNCWYAPSNIATEGLDIETSADEKRILRDRIAGMVGQTREGFRDGFEQGVNELRYFKQGYNLGFKEAKEEELREQREEANRKPIMPLDQALESEAQNLKDKAVGAVRGALDAGARKITSVVGNAIGGLGGGFHIGGSLFIEEDSKITKHKTTLKHHRADPPIPEGQGLRVGSGAAEAMTAGDTSCVMCQFYVEHINFLFHLNANNPANAQVFLQDSMLTEEEEKTLALLAEKVELKHNKKKIEKEKEHSHKEHHHAASSSTHSHSHAATTTTSHSHKSKTHNQNKAHAKTHITSHTSSHNKAHTTTHSRAHTHGPLTVSPSAGQLPSDKRDELEKILANPPDFSPTPEQKKLPVWEQPSPAYEQLVPRVYQQFSSLCAQHVPFTLLDTCTALMPKFPAIAEALRFGDRADEICRSITNSCVKGTYLDKEPHVVS